MVDVNVAALSCSAYIAAVELLSVNIPVSILWEQIVPPYSPDRNTALMLIEGLFTVSAATMMMCTFTDGLVVPRADRTFWTVNTVLAPYFMLSSLMKLRHAVRGVAGILRGG